MARQALRLIEGIADVIDYFVVLAVYCFLIDVFGRLGVVEAMNYRGAVGAEINVLNSRYTVKNYTFPYRYRVLTLWIARNFFTVAIWKFEYNVRSARLGITDGNGKEYQIFGGHKISGLLENGGLHG